MKRSLTALSLATALCLSASKSIACRLALVLAMDVSSSVDAVEDRLQRAGLAAALVSPDVIEAFLAIPDFPVALSVFEWSGRNQQAAILPWTLLPDERAVRNAAAVIARSSRRHSDFPTALGHALGHAAGMLTAAPDCARQVVDVSGDGKNNAGFGPADAYRHFPFDGVTVNALTIGGASDGLSEYFRAEVLRGSGAFLIEATGYRDFEQAMRRKLVREASPPQIGWAE